MKDKIFVITFLILIVLGGSVYAESPEITANSAIVMDCIDGKILYEKNINEKVYPASITKILTAILVVENCKMEDNVIISQEAIDNVQRGYLTANIKEGEILTVEQLLNLLLISSCNDVSNALAEHIAGSEEEFAHMMNKKAKEIGCMNSNFINSDGEHNEKHYSTAYDMALIGKYAMQYDIIKEISSKIYYELGETNKYTGKARLYEATNEMILSGSKNYYKYAKGLKTGFTTPAGYCFMAYSEKKDIPTIALVMKSTTSDSRYEDCRNILEYSYKNNMIKTVAKSGVTMQTITIKNATKDTKKLNAILEKDIDAVIKVENKDINNEPKVTINDLSAPIEKGEIIGQVTYNIDGKIYTGNLIASNSAKKSHKVLIFILIFIAILILFGVLRILELCSRNKTLRKIRNNK